MGHEERMMVLFQSAPLTEAKGDPIPHDDAYGHLEFQSAPLTEAKGDPGREGTGAPASRFNPLP